jgi:hypothetical protein
MATSGGGLTLLPTIATARLLLTCRPSCEQINYDLVRAQP